MFNQEPYLNYVAEQAQKRGKIFFLDSGEGNDFLDPKTGWYIENLSGWLINSTEREKFLAAQENGTADDDFADSYVFAKWSKTADGKLHITFKHY